MSQPPQWPPPPQSPPQSTQPPPPDWQWPAQPQQPLQGYPPYPPGQYPPGYGAPPGYPYAMGYATPPRDIGQDAGIRLLLPVGRSFWAIAAGYLGLLSVIPIFAPFALGCGIIAIVDMRRNPHRHGMGRAIFGIVMGGIFCVALVAMLIAIATNA